MDRSWITRGVTKLSSQHIKGVKEFVQFVSLNFAKDAVILCPCCQCMNRKEQAQGRVEDHLLIYGMASTYDRWIHHGEPLHVEPQHAEVDAQQPHHGHDDDIDFMEQVLQENAGLEEEDGDEEDRIPDMLKNLYNSKDHVDGQKSMFAEVFEEAKRSAVEGGKYE